MLKKSLIAIAVLAIALPAIAGDVKVHDWPTVYSKVNITTIEVCLDVGFFIHIKDQDCIKVTQDTSASDPYKTYTGCVTSDTESNFDATLSASITDISSAGGKWSVKLNGSSTTPITKGNDSVEICVTGEKVDIGKLTGGDSDVPVAEVTIQVVPQGSP